MDRDPNEISDEAVAAATEWRDQGNWLLRALAEESDGRLVERAPGCFIESTLDPPPPTPSV